MSQSLVLPGQHLNMFYFYIDKVYPRITKDGLFPMILNCRTLA
jgi:hypothetical protein